MKLAFLFLIIFYFSIISLPEISFELLHSKSSFKYTNLELSCPQIDQSVSILEESSKNCSTFSAFNESSVILIKSTDSLNHSAIFIL